ncbi:MAG TPA: hypothetical protein VGB84_06440 [Arachidicoccus sp.]
MRFSNTFLLSNILLMMPLICAAACLLCVSVILFFVFKPQKPVRILGMKVQGLLLAKQTVIQNSIADKLTEIILSKKTAIDQGVASPENMEKIIPDVETHIQEFLTVRLPQDLPMIAMFLGEKTTHQIKEVFMKELRVLFPNVISQYFNKMLNEQKLHEMILKQLSDTSVTSAISGLWEKSKPLFFKLRLFACLLGFAIGCIFTFVIYLFA